METNLKGTAGIITGGGHGIGRAYCLGLAKEGAKIVIADIDLLAAEETRDLIEKQSGTALAIQTDVANEQSTIKMAESTMQDFGSIDFLVNNAAVFWVVPMSRVGFDKVPLEEWDKMMLVNLKGMWLSCRAVAPYMKKQKSGKIVNISSGSVFSGTGKRIHYVTSKAGVLGFTRTLARELGEYNITVNALAPGSTLNVKPDTPETIARREKAVGIRCLKRYEYPEDLVGTMIYLCSSASDFMTGQTLIVDGGNMML
ncbi:SDR family NAD(P)-dependent oxidoreductase [Thermodesulfobacteriota bacterium]